MNENIMVLAEKLEKDYQNLINASGEFFNDEEKRLVAKQRLDETIAIAYSNGDIDGKNATERTANELKRFADDFCEIKKLEEKARKSKEKLNICQIVVEYDRALLIVYELLK